MKITDNISSIKEARVIAISPEWFDIKIEKSAKNIFFLENIQNEVTSVTNQ